MLALEKASRSGILPPTFIYFVALLVWIPFACLVLVLGRSDGTEPRYPPQRISACSSNGGDFSVCFPFQAAAAPLIAAMVVGVAWLQAFLDAASTVTHVTTNGLVAATISGIVLLAFVTMLTVSILDSLRAGCWGGAALMGSVSAMYLARTDG